MRKVLLVDDDALQLQIREMIFREAGLETIAVTSTEAALSILRSQDSENPVGIVISDHLMPGLHGPEFVHEMRRIAPGLPIVVLSGLQEAEPEYEGQNVFFRLKPCSPSEMISLVQRLMKDEC